MVLARCEQPPHIETFLAPAFNRPVHVRHCLEATLSLEVDTLARDQQITRVGFRQVFRGDVCRTHALTGTVVRVRVFRPRRTPLASAARPVPSRSRDAGSGIGTNACSFPDSLYVTLRIEPRMSAELFFAI